MADGTLPTIPARSRKGHKNGFGPIVRAYVAEHPGLDSTQIGHALGAAPGEVSRSLAKMVRAGIIVATTKPRSGSRAPSLTYTLGRAPMKPHAMSPEERRRRKRECDARRFQRKQAAAKLTTPSALSMLAAKVEAAAKVPTPRVVIGERCAIKADAQATRLVAPETVAQFLARGGRVQTLPGFVHSPDLRRRGQQHFRQGGAA